MIQLQPPSRENGYQQTAVRHETAEEAAEVDRRITAAWSGHPNLHVIASDASFLVKLERAVELIRAQLPECCARRQHEAIARLRRPDAMGA